MEHSKLFTEAKARIIWGESSSSVRDFLVASGISTSEADTKIGEFMVERNAELRKIGIRNVLIGTLLTVAGGATLYMVFPRAYAFSSGIVRSLAFVVIAVMIGLWKLVTGIVYLVRPRSEHKSIPDINESDILD